MIMEATKNMDDNTATTWFCEHQGNHTVFEREQGHYYIDPPYSKNPQTHKGRCEGWLKVQKAARKQEIEAEED